MWFRLNPLSLPERVLGQADQDLLATADVRMGDVLVRLVRKGERAGTVAHAIAVAASPGDDRGIRVPGEEADFGIRFGNVIGCCLEGRETRGRARWADGRL